MPCSTSPRPGRCRRGGRGRRGGAAPVGAPAVWSAAGAAHLEVRGARIKDLYRATFSGKRPLVTVDPGGEVSIQYKGFFGMRDVGAQVTLTTAVPWSIETRRGISHLDADLAELQ